MAYQQQQTYTPPQRDDVDFKALAKRFSSWRSAAGEKLVWLGEDELRIVWNRNDEIRDEAAFEIFLYFCKEKGLDPITGDVYAQCRRDNSKNKFVLSPIVSINVFRERRAPFCDGIGEPVFTHFDNGAIDTVTGWIKRKGCAEKFSTTLYFTEYAAYTRDGKLTMTWRTKSHMIFGKCLEAALSRLAFSDVCDKMYIAEEMEREDSFTDQPESFRVASIEEPQATAEETPAKDGHAKSAAKQKAKAKAPAPAPDPAPAPAPSPANTTAPAKPSAPAQAPAEPAKPAVTKEDFRARCLTMCSEVFGNTVTPQQFMETFTTVARACFAEFKITKEQLKEGGLAHWVAAADTLEEWLRTGVGKHLFKTNPASLGTLMAREEAPTDDPQSNEQDGEPSASTEEKAADDSEFAEQYVEWASKLGWKDKATINEAAALLQDQRDAGNQPDENMFGQFIATLGINKLDDYNAYAALTVLRRNVRVGLRLMALRATLQEEMIGVVAAIGEKLGKDIPSASADEIEAAITQLEPEKESTTPWE